MGQRRTPMRGRRDYRKPTLRKRRRLADVAEGVNIFVTGNVSG